MSDLLANLGPLSAALAVAGLVWGFVADRIGARWPAHEDGSVRSIDWRTLVVAAFGALALAAVPARFGEPVERILFGGYFAALVLLMSTDLDQRLLPDAVTYPLIAVGALVTLAGIDPLTRDKLLFAVTGAIVVPAVLYALSIPFGSGAFGIGDVKLLVAFGLVAGILRSAIAVFFGAMLAGVVVVVLLLARRITLRSYIPFGPFLIIGAVWAALLPSAAG